METVLQLLMRDGAIYISFKSRLTPEQYAELDRATKAATTKDELRAAISAVAIVWDVEVEVSDSL
jgi:hypothetical protein